MRAAASVHFEEDLQVRALPNATAGSADRAISAKVPPGQFAENRLLAALSELEWRRCQPLLEWTDLAVGEVLYESGTALTYLYFPTTAVIALLYTMQNGASAASALVGNDGVVGVSLFMGGESTPGRALVQIAGKCLRLTGLKEEFRQYGPILRLLLRYTQALITQIVQSAACHRHHSLDQQLCRWLLLSFDRLQANEFTTTRHVIADILGTHRGHITDHILQLHKNGVIRYARGHITLLKREMLEAGSCECYLAVKTESARLLSYILAA
jgi:CRP-like cAMP-binding protein